jgi:hypothetical protein
MKAARSPILRAIYEDGGSKVSILRVKCENGGSKIIHLEGDM